MNLQKKSFNSPDEVLTFPNIEVKLVKLEGTTLAISTFAPGWKWSESIKPVVKTESCQVLHTQYHVSGTLHVKMEDGTEMEFGPGDVSVIPPGHDAWVVGDEPVVALDITGYAGKK